MKKVLIITYYWPPSGGGGVMRWLKMTKYLPEFGWQPVVYTPENPDPSVLDESLINEINKSIIEVKTKIWEPYHIYRLFTGKKKNERLKAGHISDANSGNWKNKLSVFLRGNLFIPDPRVFWVNPSVKFLLKYLKKNPVDLIVSTGPPHSMHLIANKLKKATGIYWIADFRDPWSDIDFYQNLRLTKWADKKHKKLEKEVLKSADKVITVSPDCARGLKLKYNREIDIIYNGYDPEDFDFNAPQLDRLFTISHYGSLNRDRNPISLWKALNYLANSNESLKNDLRIQLIGQVDDSVIKSIKANGLYDNLSGMEQLPHKEGLKLLSTSQILLLPLNDSPNVKGILPGKMYEYFSLKRPILVIGPEDTDCALIIKETQSGICHTFNDVDGLIKSISEYYLKFQMKKLTVNTSKIEKYSRRHLAKELVDSVSI